MTANEVDQLTSSLAGAGCDDEVKNRMNECSTSKPHPRFGQYKCSNYVANSQHRRRLEQLDHIRERRFDAVQKHRGLPKGE